MDKLKIFIAECNSSVRQFIRYGLQEHFPKFECEIATNGRNIQKRLEETNVDLIIYEREMTMLSGEEFLQWRQGHSRIRKVPVIMMSSDRTEENLRNAIELGANDYLIKPLLMEQIASSIKKLIGKREPHPGDRRKSDRAKSEGKICLKYNGKTCNGQLINVSAEGILGIFKSRDNLPNILEHVQVDIRMTNRPELQGLTAEVIRMQAVDSVLGLEYVHLVVKFDGDSRPEKKREFESMISNLGPGVLQK